MLVTFYLQMIVVPDSTQGLDDNRARVSFPVAICPG